MSSILVSCLIKNLNTYRSIDKYIEYGIKLISQKINKIIYLEEDVFDKYFTEYKDDEYTQFRFYNRTDMYLYDYYDKIDIKDICCHVGKDNLDYFILMCNKTEIMRLAIEENYYKTDNYIWIDFGIYHILSGDINLESLANKKYDKIRIAGGILFENYELVMYKKIIWFFLGGIFGGNSEKLLEFANKTKEACIDLINTRGILLWEVNIWFFIYKKHPELFDRYMANHNNSLIKLY